MGTDRFDRKKTLLHAIGDLAPKDRAAFLDAECIGDPELRAEIEKLIADADDLGDFATLDRVSHVDEQTVASRSRPVMEAKGPSKIGEYRIVGELGRGGMGIVYLAEDAKLGRTIALKILPRTLSSHPESLSRFQQEARLLAAMTHPHIATIHSLEEADGHHFLTMEHVPGDTMTEQIDKEPWTTDKTLVIARQIASALESAHKRGVIHRDLKPQNIKITPEGGAKVLDFGLAKSITAPADDKTGASSTTDLDTEFGPSAPTDPNDTSESRTSAPANLDPSLTAAGTVLGTPGYMSPEQLRGEETDGRTDVWALGCTIFAALSGGSPFRQPTAVDTFSATLHRDPPWETLPPTVPDRVRDFLARCLEKKQDERLESMIKVRHEIDGLMRRDVSNAAPVGSSEVSNNIPRSLSEFVGRAEELPRLAELLREQRIVTVVGGGGCGKTRLAQELAESVLHRFPDGVWFVELAPLTNATQVTGAITKVLSAESQTDLSPAQCIQSSIESRSMLLVLDNAEHVPNICRELVESLSSCPNLHILTTSQVPLNVEGESLFPLAALATPATHFSLEEIQANDAVRLFAVRARAIDPAFEVTSENAASVSEVCRRLDGIPLAIELAAARINVFAPDELRKRINRRFNVLTRGGKPTSSRHRTLRALIDWSYELLEANERTILRRLSIFAGGWTLEAAEAICSDETIEEWEVLDIFTSLIEKSLVFRDSEPTTPHRATRYRMYESVRDYSREQLEKVSETVDVERKHRTFFAEFAKQARKYQRGPDQGKWLPRLAADHENLFQAIESAITDIDSAELGLFLVGDLDVYWWGTNRLEEGYDAAVRMLKQPDGQLPSRARSHALDAAAFCSSRTGRIDECIEYRRESLDVLIELGEPGSIVRGKTHLAAALGEKGEFAEEARLNKEALLYYRENGPQHAVASVLHNTGVNLWRQGHLQTAIPHLEECIAMKRDEEDLWGTALALLVLGHCAHDLGQITRSIECRTESAALFGKAGFRVEHAAGLARLAAIELENDQEVAAWSHLVESLEVLAELNAKVNAGFPLAFLASVAGKNGDHEIAGMLLGLALELYQSTADSLSTEGELSNKTKTLEQTRSDLGDAVGQEALEHLLARGAGLSLRAALGLVSPESPVASAPVTQR